MLCLVLKKITDVDIRRGTEVGKGCGTHTVLVAETAGFTMSGISIDNSSNYAVLGYELSDSQFAGLRITGGWDGIHIRGVESVNVSECDFSTGDDCMAGGYWHNMVIDRCRFNSSCNGLRMIMPSEDVRISGCAFIGPDDRDDIYTDNVPRLKR